MHFINNVEHKMLINHEKIVNDESPIYCLLFRAERMGCVNSKWPDLYGHYREAKFTQTKHHWWWKANRIYNELRVTKNYDGKLAAFIY